MTEPSEPDREYLEQLAERIDAHGVAIEYRSNLQAVASRLLQLRVAETDPTRRERLDLELDAAMRVLDGREPHPPSDKQIRNAITDFEAGDDR